MKTRWGWLCALPLTLALTPSMGCGKSEPKAPDPVATTTKPATPATPATTGPASAPPATTAPHSHGEPGHEHKAPHGGQVVEAGPYHLEAVASKAGLMLFLLDDNEATLPIEGVKGTVLLKNGDKAPIESTFEPMGNHLHAMAVPEAPWVAAVTLEVKGQTITARFEGGKDHGHDHGDHGHDHGAGGHDHGDGGHDHGDGGHDHGDGGHAAMPGMKLSDTVDAVLTVDPVVAGQPAKLQFGYKARAGGEPLADFEVVHEERLHMFVVKKDMSFFDHVHPVVLDAAAGTWLQEQVFPTPGEYRIYSDFKSTKLGANVTVTTLVVPGDAPADLPLTIDTAMTKKYGDLTITLKTEPTPLGASDAMLRYTVSDASGQPVTNLEPYLGAFGHLFILNEDLVTMAHAHPRGAEPTPEMRAGPEVAFHATLPKAGRYKLWAQFKHAGQIVTTDWAVEVK